MRSPGLVVMGLAGLAVVGYAFYTLLAPPEPRSGAGRSRGEASKRAKDEAAEAAEADEADEADEAGEPAKGSRKVRPRPSKTERVELEPPAEQATPSQPRPSQPEPEVSLAEARKQWADYMAELDALAARGAHLTSPEWVELYKRGHDLLRPLQQHLDYQVPTEARELKMANEDMRARLNKIDPNRPEPPPSP